MQRTNKYVDEVTQKYRAFRKLTELQKLEDNKQPSLFTEERLSRQDSDVSKILREIKNSNFGTTTMQKFPSSSMQCTSLSLNPKFNESLQSVDFPYSVQEDGTLESNNSISEKQDDDDQQHQFNEHSASIQIQNSQDSLVMDSIYKPCIGGGTDATNSSRCNSKKNSRIIQVKDYRSPQNSSRGGGGDLSQRFCR